jgi:hypothetical protein
MSRKKKRPSVVTQVAPLPCLKIALMSLGHVAQICSKKHGPRLPTGKFS